MTPRSAETSTTLQGLLERGADDPAAYQQLLAHTWERLLQLTRKMLRQFPRVHRWEETEDVFQAAAMRLFTSLSVVRPSNLRAFLGLAATQIRRTLIDLARHHFGPLGAAARHHSDPVIGPAAQQSPGPSVSSAPDSLDDWADFHEAIERLPDELREVFSLRWYQGLAQTEIAQMLGVSVPTVQRRWYAAQIAIYDALHGEMPGEQA